MKTVSSNPVSNLLDRAAWLAVVGWLILAGCSTPPATDKAQEPVTAPLELAIAAEQGEAEAQYDLGRKLLAGDGVAADPAKGADWIQKAAKQGLPKAQITLSGLYLKGEGVEMDEVKAFDWMRRAAAQNDPEAQLHLGAMLRVGRGTPRDFTAASQWVRKSAEQGLAQAQTFLGTLYSTGQGVPQNDREAVRWFRYAAEQGNGEAQYNLGVKYDTGRGVRTDYVEAYKWLNLSAAQGNPTAMSARDKIVRKMTREQITEAQRRSSAFVPNPGLKPILDVTGAVESDQPIEANGTGVFLTEDGFLLTTYHLVVDAQKVAIKKGKDLLPAVIIRSDPVNDLVLLKVEGQYKSVPIGPSRTVKVGDAIFTVGFPTLLTPPDQPHLAEGNIKQLAGLKDDPRFFQVSLPLRAGNTGGPVIDALGNLIGMAHVPPGSTVPLSDDTPLYFHALKSSYVTVFLESIPEVVGKLKPASTAQGRKFEELVKETREAVVLVLAL
ncbi:MAG TPA: tetratricopeptide repeat-containing serine protease family protein [Candidatus Paceibacterota bacterium]|nr:tetratricopeptide repeat-containing serine protease family protein [Verrucomicrobiota bacterium]HRY47357.1 tetratricopeptide repeat-containing serine protease family protein [Candidatus Paceibacterota bacterium]HSA03613.1 tetratricopeptide repeat-containing serine protease family protein [Candidatus Paceibacterota bacterium]